MSEMTDDGSVLNENERKVRDLVKPEIKDIGTIVKVKQEGDKIEIEIVSPNHFEKTAAALGGPCGEAAQATGCAIDVNLATHWPVKPA